MQTLLFRPPVTLANKPAEQAMQLAAIVSFWCRPGSHHWHAEPDRYLPGLHTCVGADVGESVDEVGESVGESVGEAVGASVGAADVGLAVGTMGASQAWRSSG